MSDAIRLTVRGLKCDAVGCDYRDEEAPHPGERYEDYLDAPCPQCGAPLLTLADLRAMHRIERRVRRFNRVCHVLSWLRLMRLSGEHTHVGRVNMNGTGRASVTLEKAP